MYSRMRIVRDELFYFKIQIFKIYRKDWIRILDEMIMKKNAYIEDIVQNISLCKGCCIIAQGCQSHP